MRFLSIAILPFAAVAYGLVPPSNDQPIVSLSYATFQGVTDGNLTRFLGMPYAQPPINDLRFRRPRSPGHLPGVQKADKFGAACPQQTFATVPHLSFPPANYSSISEDCLTINVIKPAALTITKGKLPVVFWIHGGGWETGDASDAAATSLVERSILLGQPVIFVTANYRLSAFGFLGGQEVAKANVANLGLHDQILALQWVQKYISSFGGDAGKVTLFGINAGAISAGLHLLTNDGKSTNLFRGAFMLSGSPSATSPVKDGQEAYDQLIQDTHCANTPDTLSCLRQVPFPLLMSAVSKSRGLFSYSGLANEWKPRVDGDLIKKHPFCLISEGRYAKVPIVSGSSDDEGTMFSLSNLNVTTDDEFTDYMQTYLLAGTTDSQMKAVDKAYPSDPALGSPFATGNNNTLTPEYKRLSSIQGDIIFQAPRRLLLEAASKTQKTWAYLYKRGKSLPLLGALHDGDIGDWFAVKSTDFIAADSLIRFINKLDPNQDGKPKNSTFWPEWGSSRKNPPLLTFTDPAGINVTPDTYRSDGFNLLNKLAIDQAHEEGTC